MMAEWIPRSQAHSPAEGIEQVSYWGDNNDPQPF